jgi:hypothetical protein
MYAVNRRWPLELTAGRRRLFFPRGVRKNIREQKLFKMEINEGIAASLSE